jgi:hypothetical protein
MQRSSVPALSHPVGQTFRDRPVIICNGPFCQTTAGCQCDRVRFAGYWVVSPASVAGQPEHSHARVRS